MCLCLYLYLYYTCILVILFERYLNNLCFAHVSNMQDEASERNIEYHTIPKESMAFEDRSINNNNNSKVRKEV